jgi:simple sugar transport system ATP-binding protein
MSIGQRQKVELLKVLIRGVDVLILDEPTSVLTPQETEELFVQLKKLKEQGISIVFISHKLDEIIRLCDRITVLRRGQSVGTDLIKNLNEEKIAKMMLGRDVNLKIDKEASVPGKAVAEIQDLVYVDGDGRRVLDRISFTIRSGEIVGIAGIEGNGQQEIADLLSGILPIQHGSVRINGREIKGKSIRSIRDMGVAYISEDRIKHGCAPALSIRDNIIADRMHKKEFRKGVFLDKKKIERFVDKCIQKFEIACDHQDEPVKFLSGGNIQKVVVAREFTSGADLIIANQPTRGIDVGTTEMIRKTIVKMTKSDGIAALLVSSDLNEIFEVSDRLFIIRKGKFVAHFNNVKNAFAELLGEYMLGVKTMSQEEMGTGL